jgi:hypothetical protein
VAETHCEKFPILKLPLQKKRKEKKRKEIAILI